ARAARRRPRPALLIAIELELPRAFPDCGHDSFPGAVTRAAADARLRRRMRLRFAPSPTGFLHVGGARTAIFNLLHARRYGGTMLLRIEDTDVERSKQHHAEQIVSSLHWLGGECAEGPLYQSDRLALYRERAEELVASGKAYRCYCTVEELEEERVAAEAEGRAWRYSGRCRALVEQN